MLVAMAVTETPSWRSTSWKKLRCCRRSSNSSAPSTCVPRVVSRKLVRCALVGIGGAGERANADEEGRDASSKPPLRRGAVCASTVQSCVRFDWRVTRLKGRAVVHQDVEQRLRTTELTDGLQVAIELHELIHGHEHALQHERLRSGEETPQGSAPLMGKGGEGGASNSPARRVRRLRWLTLRPPVGQSRGVGGRACMWGAPHGWRAVPRACAAAGTRRQTRG